MPRQAIALLAALVAIALAACGGDGGDTTTAPAPSAEQAQPSQGAEEVQRRAQEIEKERRTGAPSPDAGQKDEDAPQTPAPSPPAEHQDSGGGADQVLRKGGDNAIQEFGQEGGGSELASAASELHAYLDARAAGRWEDACSYLAPRVVASLEQFAAARGEGRLEGCPDILQALSSGAGTAGLRAADQVDVGSLRLQGSRGFLLYHGPQGVDFAMPVVLEAGEWKLAAPDATPLP